MDNSTNLYDNDEDLWGDRGNAGDGDDEYDALNEETFGSAADEGDWEEGHMQFTNITEAQRYQRQRENSLREIASPIFKGNPFPEGLQNSFEAFHFEEKARSIGGFAQAGHIRVPSAALNEHSTGSPVESIWSSLFRNNDPTSLTPKIPDNKAIKQQFLPTLEKSNPALAINPRIIPAAKTVSELEQEMKWHSLGNQQVHSMMKLEQLEHNLYNNAAQPRILKPGAMEPRCPPPHFQPHKVNSMTSPALPFSNFPNHIRHPFSLKEKGIPHHNMNNPFYNKMLHDMKNPGFHGNSNNHPHGFNHSNFLNKTMPPPSMNHRRFPYGHHDQRMRHHGPDPYNRNSRNHFDQFKNHSESINGFVKEYNSNGGRTRRDSDSEWEEWLLLREKDEFAGLMTPREKNWLKNIQSMQLQTDNPYQDDYYYVMHKAHEQRKLGQEIIEVNGLQLLADKSKDGKEYEPPQLENSLGKLQVVSVNAPRKIIDFDLTQSSTGGATSPSSKCLQSDMRKRRHMLLHIEKLWDVHIELADLERKIRALPDCPTRDLFRVKCRQLVEKLWSGLSVTQDTFTQILCIKKGKTLCAHLLRWLGENEIEQLVATIIQNIPIIAKRDSQDGQLDTLWPAIDRLFVTSSSSRLATFATMASVQLKQAHKNNFIPMLDCRLTFSTLLCMLVRSEEIWSEVDKESSWHDFLASLVAVLLQASKRSQSKRGTGASPSPSPTSSTSNLHLPLPSVSLAASPRNITSQILRCSADSQDVLTAAEFLKQTEDLLQKKKLPS